MLPLVCLFSCFSAPKEKKIWGSLSLVVANGDFIVTLLHFNLNKSYSVVCFCDPFGPPPFIYFISIID